MLEWLYPRKCALCDEILTEKHQRICSACRRSVSFLKEPLCFCCGRPMQDAEAEYCGACKKQRHLFDAGFAPFAYTGMVKDGILRLKYGQRPENAVFFAGALAAFGEDRIRRWQIDLLLPVPLHKRREAVRGYNQAALIAEALSRRSGIPVYSDIIVRKKNTRPQKELNYEKRFLNMRHAFSQKRPLPAAGNILIVDDIFTTGSTSDCIAGILKKAGAAHVYVACAAIAVDEKLCIQAKI